MFDSKENTAAAITARKAGLYVVKTAEYLLAQSKRQILVTKIRQNCGLREERYDQLYQPVITAFVEFVQSLPFYPRGKLGGLMDYGLVRAGLALQLCKEEPSFNDPFAAYAIFTVSLLRDIGRVLSQQRILICDAQGQFLSEWQPFGASLVEKADFYKIRYSDDRWLALGQTASPLLARQLIPEIGFSLLAGNNDLLQKWLNILLGNRLTEGDPLQNLLQLLDQQLEDELNKAQLPDLPMEITHPEETALGEEFLAWLSENLENGELTIGQADSWVHDLDSGALFLDKQVFNLFCQRYGSRTDWVTVLRQFNLIGLTRRPKEDGKLEKFYANYDNSAIKTRVSYFLTGGSSSSKESAKTTGLRKVLEGITLTRPELLGVNLKRVAKSPQLSLQPVESSSSESAASQNDKLTEYLERRMDSRILGGKPGGN